METPPIVHHAGELAKATGRLMLRGLIAMGQGGARAYYMPPTPNQEPQAAHIEYHSTPEEPQQ